MTLTIPEITAEKGDIVRHVDSGVEYVYYGPETKTLEGGQSITYPRWLMENEHGRLSEPFVVLNSAEGAVEFVERGAPREPGEKPVRPLQRPSEPGKGEIKARPGRLS